jgi:hypothetical protein
MKKIVNAFEIVFLFSFLISNSLFAQQKTNVTTEEKNGLNSVKFKTEKGGIKAYLPSDLFAGDVISGTVVAEPNGKNQKQVEKNSKILNGYVIELGGQETPVKQGKEKWKLPEVVKDGILYLLLKDTKGNEIGKTAIPTNSIARQRGNPDILRKTDFDIPSYFEKGKPVKISGYFDGDFSTSGIKLNDVPANILAESPEGIFFETPEDITGPVDVELTEGDFSLEGQTNVLDLNLTADKLTLTKREQTTVHISVTGLEGLDMDVPLEITNLTPQNIRTDGSVSQEIIIKPKDVSEDGTFWFDLAITAINTGGFSIQGNILIKPRIVLRDNNFVENNMSRDVTIWEITDKIDSLLNSITMVEIKLLDKAEIVKRNQNINKIYYSSNKNVEIPSNKQESYIMLPTDKKYLIKTSTILNGQELDYYNSTYDGNKTGMLFNINSSLSGGELGDWNEEKQRFENNDIPGASDASEAYLGRHTCDPFSYGHSEARGYVIYSRIDSQGHPKIWTEYGDYNIIQNKEQVCIIISVIQYQSNPVIEEIYLWRDAWCCYLLGCDYFVELQKSSTVYKDGDTIPTLLEPIRRCFSIEQANGIDFAKIFESLLESGINAAGGAAINFVTEKLNQLINEEIEKK